MSTQSRWIAAAVALLAVGQASAQSYANPSYANPSYAHGNGYGYGYTRVLRCESIGSRSNFCRVETQGRVYVSRQLSQRTCVQGRNWNYNYRGIWVGGGCRADFAVVTRHDDRHGGGYGSSNRRGWDDHDGDSRYAGNDWRDGNRQGDWNRDGSGRDDRYSRYGSDDPRYGDQDDDASNSDSGYYDQQRR